MAQTSAMDFGLHLGEDAVDRNGIALYVGVTTPPTPRNDSTIAPWLDEPPPLPPKLPTRSNGFGPKNSFSSFASKRQNSATSLRQVRPNPTAQSAPSIPEGRRPSIDDRDSMSGTRSAGSSIDSGEMWKSKSPLNFITKLRSRSSKNLRADLLDAEERSLHRVPPLPDASFMSRLKSRSSRGNIRGSLENEHPSLHAVPPVPDSLVSFLDLPGPSNSLVSLSLPRSIKERSRKKKKYSSSPPPPTPPPKDPKFKFDLNIDEMDGIINPELASSNVGSVPRSNDSIHNPFLLSSPDFNNPFTVTPIAEKRKGVPVIPLGDYRRISPKTIAAYTIDPTVPLATSSSSASIGGWEAPESWAVEKDGKDSLEGHYASSDESVQNCTFEKSKQSKDDGTESALRQRQALSHKRKRRSNTIHRHLAPQSSFMIPIYREDDSYEILPIQFNQPVSSLIPILNESLLPHDRRGVQHKLYMKERGGERLLAPTEKPADILRRRLEQAGYDPLNGLSLLGGDGLMFLLKFVYKSQVLGIPDDNLVIDRPELIDLTGRSLTVIPVILHKHADSIISLKLSRNPMLEIPLDFIQSCTALRELRLNNMAMKKVPQSIHHSTTLHRLDISSNRISDLTEANLEEISTLRVLFAQNNRIEALPKNFFRHRSLTTLNISNNKFHVFPVVVSKLESLAILDISFNAITELPEEIGNLKTLERLIMVGNSVSKLPDRFRDLTELQFLDCRRNRISNLSAACMLPNLQRLSAEQNAISALDLSLGPKLGTLCVSHNDITTLSLKLDPNSGGVFALTSLDLSFSKLSTLESFPFRRLSSLRVLTLDRNLFRYLPETIGDLDQLETLSCSDNHLEALPASIGNLHKLTSLDVHNNSLSELPLTLWNCTSLAKINAASNLIKSWHDPPVISLTDSSSPPNMDRKPSTVSLGNGNALPPLVQSLQKLYLGENRLTDDVLHPLMIFKELRVLNLSFNEIQDLPAAFFRNMTNLEAIYLSGNKLMSIPTEHLESLQNLTTIFLNGNKLQTLPKELGALRSLTTIDIGSNLLKYNINNVDFDWNWNFNSSLKYLNLSGNNRLQIRLDHKLPAAERHSMPAVHGDSGFSRLSQLRVLGLMDVTITSTGMDDSQDIPDETETRRVRTSTSTVKGMGYGIADSLCRNDKWRTIDLVHEFPGRKDEALFAMFGHVAPPNITYQGINSNRHPKFLHERCIPVFQEQINQLSPHETITDALHRTFLKLNQDLYYSLFPSQGPVDNPPTQRSGASGIMLHFQGKKMHVAHVGNALAVVSRTGVAHSVATKHDPYDRNETARIRAAEGWVSPAGLVNDEIDTSRAFGFHHLLPVINARPEISVWELTELDEFVIVANRGLWDFVPYQTAVDIARTVIHTERPDPMIAAQKLRDFATSYGADGDTMIMVIWVADLFNSTNRSRQPTLNSLTDPQYYRVKKKGEILDRNIARLDDEVNPPVGHITLVFTDIRNSTHLWEVNPGMATAIRLHNSLLRRHLRFCGGYEVKTEGDAFMCSFTTPLAAVWWCLTVQCELLNEPWPLEILECEDGKPIYDSDDQLIARGLSVRMGIHCGSPSACEPDPITKRMDYFGSMVNRSARINGSAAGGRIMCSADVIHEIEACVLGNAAQSEISKMQPQQAIDAIKRIGVIIEPVGEVKLKGLEMPELLSQIYPSSLIGRRGLQVGPTDPTLSGSRVQFSIPQIRELGVLCLRLEYLAIGKVFQPVFGRKQSIPTTVKPEEHLGESPFSIFVQGDPYLLLPPMDDHSTDSDMMFVLDSLSVRISNALSSLAERCLPPGPSVEKDVLISALKEGGITEEALRHILTVLQGL